MLTRLKNQALNVSVIGEQGFGGIRYYNDTLSAWSNNEWIDLIQKEVPYSLSYKLTTGTDWTTLTYNDEDELKTGIKGIYNLGLLDVKVTASEMTNLYKTFYSFRNLSSFDGSKMEVSNVTNMANMFDFCSNLTNINGLSNWNTENVTNMHYMFIDCTNLTNVNALDNWNTRKVTTTLYMFYGCNNLTNDSVISIVNMCINATHMTVKNLNTLNVFSPLCGTKFNNSYYTSLHSALTAAGWTY